MAKPKNRIAGRREKCAEVLAEGKHGGVVLYCEPGQRINLQVRLEADTLRLSQKQMSEPFTTERSLITKHLRNMFTSWELRRDSVCAKFAHTAEDGKTYQTMFCSLDAILSVGYRINFKLARGLTATANLIRGRQQGITASCARTR